MLCDFSSRCHGFVCSLRLWYFLVTHLLFFQYDKGLVGTKVLASYTLKFMRSMMMKRVFFARPNFIFAKDIISYFMVSLYNLKIRLKIDIIQYYQIN